MKRLAVIAALCIAALSAEAGISPVAGLGGGSGSLVVGRTIHNANVAGMKGEECIVRGGQSYDETALSMNPVAYFPLTSGGENLADQANPMVLTNVTFTTGAAYFNGTSAFGLTTSTLNLTGTNKLTVAADIKFASMNLAADMSLIEPANVASAGVYALLISGTTANDPIDIYSKGNVGASQFLYNLANTPIADLAYHSYIGTVDYSLATDENALYLDGSLKTPDTKLANINNTASFGNYKYYFGSRTGTISFSNIYAKGIAFYSGILSARQSSTMNAAR